MHRPAGRSNLLSQYQARDKLTPPVPEILRAAGIMPPLREIPLSLASRRDEDGQNDIDHAAAEIASLQVCF